MDDYLGRLSLFLEKTQKHLGRDNVGNLNFTVQKTIEKKMYLGTWIWEGVKADEVKS